MRKICIVDNWKESLRTFSGVRDTLCSQMQHLLRGLTVEFHSYKHLNLTLVESMSCIGEKNAFLCKVQGLL